jgi:hypothetical protein
MLILSKSVRNVLYDQVWSSKIAPPVARIFLADDLDVDDLSFI